jgi:hypothetical protein
MTTKSVVTLTAPTSPTAVAIVNLSGQGSLGDLVSGDVAISGLVSDSTYYVVTAGFDAQGDQLIRLVASAQDVSNDAPIKLDASGQGSNVQNALWQAR